jgi:hypothetical protein
VPVTGDKQKGTLGIYNARVFRRQDADAEIMKDRHGLFDIINVPVEAA